MKPTFKIFSASAGSGKTYTLAKSYIKLLIASKNQDHFKHILAITFTNKAVGEMKTRIIDMLKLFSSKENLTHQHPMFIEISKELSISPEQLFERSKKVLNNITHNYGAFDISTIDGFTHRVIRTFAFDLKLPINFEVELDQDYMLTKAIDALIAKAGTDKALTKTLVDFAIEKADDDKSWDISYDFKKTGRLLLNENDLPYLNELKEKTIDDFNELKKDLYKKTTHLANQIVEEATLIINLIEEAGLQFDDFSGSYLPKHFEKLSNANFNVTFVAKWQEDLENKTLYPKRVPENIASTIEEIQPAIASAFNKTKSLLIELKFNKAIYKNITPLSVINALQKELNTLKEDENKLLISEFNTLISNEIKNQPTPFIYERLGEKFRHYFVDEFQDTSKMQWENLIPLMDNALSSTHGSAMIVGDAKQAIYRWRGGDAQQFINLYEGVENPFQINAELNNLNTNYRSYKTIIDFNNSFFDFISNQFFSKEDYKSLYEDAKQISSKNQSGYVNLSFLDFEISEDRNEAYIKKTFEIVKSCLEKGYQKKDICILVRKKKEGIAVSDYLTHQNINITSSETLLLTNSPKVNLLNLVLAVLINPDDQKLRLDMLDGISKLFNIEDKHLFFKSHLNLSIEDLFKELVHVSVQLDYNSLLQMPLYEMAECLVRGLSLCENASDAYVQFYLDTVLDYSNKQTPNILGFLEFFESKKETLSISTPTTLDAVSVMTIHKSKGLEFPVVIFPFADLDMYREIEPKSWFPIENQDFYGFNFALIKFSKDFQNFGEKGQDIFNEHQSKLELDNINLLYVTLTRAIEQLYIVSKKDINSKGAINDKTYAGLLIKYLMHCNKWEDDTLEYSFGLPNNKTDNVLKIVDTEDYRFISTSKETHNLKIITNSGVLWDTEQEQAIERGNLIHLLMSKIKTKHDVDFAIESLINLGQIQRPEIEELKKTVLAIINNNEISEYFSSNYDIYNERDIITKDGLFLRPDRLAIKDKNVVIIDYKTGNIDKKYDMQLDAYSRVLVDMGFQIEKKLLVYINKNIEIIEVK
ncbi:UvrD-helicase domain-containing protein [Winogradskyella haliclonae]|uniref:DNA 3'-5' helicase n=1 Tax=Winogradskyella haliclonae TaxID=2048558 RepID=A0ABQ2BXC2_9FLAO|nr:UvrD-helicase domain-containing protein [Winogradskyella haliclonae]GGI56163.1 ATP-dependent helicase [Winogradskyella haliclonae]